MGVCYDLVDEEHRTSFELGKGPFGAAGLFDRASLDEFTTRFLVAWWEWVHVKDAAAMLYGQTLAARLHRFCELAHWSIQCVNDCGDFPIWDYEAVESRYSEDTTKDLAEENGWREERRTTARARARS